MQLAQYLDRKKIKRTEFADKVGVSPATITGWCDGTFWPSRDNAKKVKAETRGQVTPNDFLEAAR